MRNYEFKKGEIVTFKPYDKEYKCTIIKCFIDENKSMYKLEGLKESCLTTTSGLFIKESIFFGGDHD